MKTLILCLICTLWISVTYAQDDSPALVKNVKKSSHYLGLNAGFSTGVGMSFIVWGEDHGLQLTFLPIFTSNVSRYSAGVTYLNKLKEGEKSILHFFLGGHLTNLDDEQFLIIGLGPGVEHSQGDITIHFRTGFATYLQPGEAWLLPTVEAGMFYKF